MIEHPSYPFPTIREVVFEIHFHLDKEWDSAIYSEYFRTIEEQFSTFQPITVAVELRTNKGGTNVVVPQVIRYQHKSRNSLIQLSENRLSVNILPVYPGWKNVEREIEFAWNKLRDLVKPTEISRIGLRYINGIEKSSEDETLSIWLKPTDYIPKAALHSRKGFVCQTSVRLDDYNRMQVMVADQPSSPGSSGVFVFDIDRILEKTIDNATNILLEQARFLHDDIWNEFVSAKGEELERLLRGDLI